MTGIVASAEKTIIQLSTARAPSAIHVIRFSGAKTVPFLVAHTAIEKLAPRRVYYSSFCNGDKVLDRVVCFYFKAPHSYTGEDVGEIHCHGSPLIVDEILHAGIVDGLCPASPGEFTKRAFLNGKLSLEQAEAVDAVIRSRTDYLKDNALRILEKKTSLNFSSIREKLLSILAEFESAIEFPEEGEVVTRTHSYRKYQAEVTSLLEYFERIAHSYNRGKKIETGIDVVIMGRPNTGKSTLMNRLLREERVLVSDTLGTTRDFIKEEIRLGEFPVLLYDTAGLRHTQDIIERAGIEKAMNVFKEADVSIFLATSEACLEEILRLSPNRERMLIYLNKIDRLSSSAAQQIRTTFEKRGYIIRRSISLFDDECVTAVEKDLLLLMRRHFSLPNNDLSLLNERQKHITDRIIDALKGIQHLLDLRESEEVITEEFALLNRHLGELDLSVENEEIFDTLFSRFCIGK